MAEQVIKGIFMKFLLNKKLILLSLIIIAFGTGAVIYKSYQNNYNIWLSDYIFNDLSRDHRDGVTDIIFLIVDHWEPGSNEEIVNLWTSGYRQIANKHIDSDGRKLQHTWFYPIEQFYDYQIDSLVGLCRDGFGDVEIYLYHKNDNSESLREKLIRGIDSLQNHGALISHDGKTHFAFIHGNWALDNSRFDAQQKTCGVNDEISILLELGCYADFTFPALQQTAQPSLVNKIFYAVNDPLKPRSHDNGILPRKGLTTTPDQLMIFEGPLIINWADWRFKTHPTIDDGNLYKNILPSLERFELWLDADIHVIDGPNWIFVRPFCHGASIENGGIEANLGSDMDRMLSEVEISIEITKITDYII